MTEFTFLNHAGYRTSWGPTTLVGDPWFAGTAFNNGWRLLVEDERLGARAADAKFFWLSHEHPDHFSIEFFKKHQPKQATILFQKTYDKRVVGWFRANGYETVEIADGASFELSPDETLTVGKSGHYDSWCFYRNRDHRILNLNDCHFPDTRVLERMARRFGPIDLMMTQFSYASWRGGRDRAELRRRSAREKLETVVAQVKAVAPRHVLPFASFIYFCHQENAYLNDSVNTIDAVCEALQGAGAVPVVLAPGESWTVGMPRDNAAALKFWRDAYAGIGQLPLLPPGPGVTLEALQKSFHAYRERVGGKNWLSLMRLLSLVPGLGAFQPFDIHLRDLGKTVRFSFWDGLNEVPGGGAAEVAMTSENLNFVFQNEFGYDTLTVNGRFEAAAEGFRIMTKNLAIGSLNAMGLSLSPKFVANLDAALILMQRLSRFSRKL